MLRDLVKGKRRPCCFAVVPMDIYNALGMHDGQRSHALLNYSTREYYVQLGWIWLKRPSITIGWGF